MDEESEKNLEQNQEQDQQPQAPDTSRATDVAKKAGKKALKGLRGFGVAGKTAGTAAEAGAAASSAGATAGATAAEAGATAAAAATGAGGATTGATGTAVAAGGSSMGGWAVVAVVAVIFIMTILIAILGGQANTLATTQGPAVPDENRELNSFCRETAGIECVLEAPSRVNTGESITYVVKINVNTAEFSENLESLSLVQELPDNAILDSYSGKASDNAGLLVWKFSDNIPPGSSSTSGTISFTLQSTVIPEDAESVVVTRFFVEGIAQGQPEVPSGTTGAFCTLGNKDTCGRYSLNNPAGLNYGDPSCELVLERRPLYRPVNEALFAELKTYEKTADYCRWRCIMSYESGYNPNNYNANAPGNGGAWGLFQMNPHACTSPTRGTTGNVGWRQQIKNALKRNYNVLDGKFSYWSVYKNGNTCSREIDWKEGATCRCAVNDALGPNRGARPGCVDY